MVYKLLSLLSFALNRGMFLYVIEQKPFVKVARQPALSSVGMDIRMLFWNESTRYTVEASIGRCVIDS